MNIEKFKQEERIRISYLKHGGNILNVSQELQLDVKYIKKITDKFDKAQKRDIDRLVANDITRYFLLGSEQRRNRLVEIINKLTDKEKTRLSKCCKTPVNEHHFDSETLYTCVSCGKDCVTYLEDQEHIFKLILQYNSELRAEDISLIACAEKMGFTSAEPQPIHKITQYNMQVVPKSRTASELDSEITESVEAMLPAEREKLRKQIEGKIINSDSTEQ